MTVPEIQYELTRLFHNHKYEQRNSYVFDWECDFFSMAKSGYCYEVEIKLSRSDFFADFKKDKHIRFNNLSTGKLQYFHNMGPCRGDLIVRVEEKTLQKRRMSYMTRGGKVQAHELETHQDILNQWKDFYLETRMRDHYAPATRIKRLDLTKMNHPNRFYYACPEGLIKPEEVPVYAGLIYVSHYATIVKQAPFIHKRVMDLSKVLLEKFYWECYNHRIAVRKQNYGNTGS